MVVRDALSDCRSPSASSSLTDMARMCAFAVLLAISGPALGAAGQSNAQLEKAHARFEKGFWGFVGTVAEFESILAASSAIVQLERKFAKNRTTSLVRHLARLATLRAGLSFNDPLVQARCMTLLEEQEQLAIRMLEKARARGCCRAPPQHREMQTPGSVAPTRRNYERLDQRFEAGLNTYDEMLAASEAIFLAEILESRDQCTDSLMRHVARMAKWRLQALVIMMYSTQGEESEKWAEELFATFESYESRAAQLFDAYCAVERKPKRNVSCRPSRITSCRRWILRQF